MVRGVFAVWAAAAIKLDFFGISVRAIFIVDCFYNADGVLVKAIVTTGPTKAETVSIISEL
jgi:hypothetical protein